jgi:hypothetical protein
MLTEIEVEGVGIMRHLNDWQIIRIRRMPRGKVMVAMVAFSLGMTVQQFIKLPANSQREAWSAFDALTGPGAYAEPQATQRVSVPRRGEHVPIEKQIELGRQLIEMKAKLPRGHFIPWVENKSGISYAQAQRCMKAAKEVQQLPEPKLLIAGDTVPARCCEALIESIEDPLPVGSLVLSVAVELPLDFPNQHQ